MDPEPAISADRPATGKVTAFVSLLGLMTLGLWRPTLRADMQKLRTATAIGLLATVVTGYVGLFVDVALERRGVPIPMNGGLTAVMVAGFGAGLATFTWAYVRSPTNR